MENNFSHPFRQKGLLFVILTEARRNRLHTSIEQQRMKGKVLTQI